MWLPTSAVTSPAMAFNWVHDTMCGFCAVGQATVRKWLVTVVTDWPLLHEQADPVGWTGLLHVVYSCTTLLLSILPLEPA